MISTLAGSGYNDQAPPPHLAVPDQPPALDSLSPSPHSSHSHTSHILRTPEFSSFGVNFDQLQHQHEPHADPDPSQGDDGMAPSSPRPSSTIDRRSSNPSLQRKRDQVLHKSGSWRKKYATLIGGHTFNESSPVSSLDHSSGDSMDLESGPSAEATASNVAAGLYISAPLSPPVGYPMPGSNTHSTSQPMRTTIAPEDPRASVISSSSSGSSQGRGSKDDGVRPTPPQWAQPPKKTTGIRASSFDSGLDRGNVERPTLTNYPEHNPEHIRGPTGEWAGELLRGEQGRIAIKSTSSQHEVLVWLPHFSINDITIVTRKNHVLKIVADQWDENDHAQWEIRLGDDACMNTVRATFSGSELKITVARNPKLAPSNASMHSNVTMRSASSRAPSSLSAATLGHPVPYHQAHHERSFSTPTSSWSESDRRDVRDIEARMSRGAEGAF